MHKILSACPRINLTVMSTFNALSIPSYYQLINGIYDLKKTYASSDRYWTSAVFLDSSYLRHPKHQKPHKFYQQNGLMKYLEQHNMLII